VATVEQDIEQELEIAGVRVARGTRQQLEIRVARLPTGTWVSLPVAVIHGARPGPRLWLSAAIHGDELNGVEITRQVLPLLQPSQLAGTVIAVPIVNVFGFLQQDRYLPDRRDLNRSFPGSAQGSLAARLAHLFMREVVDRCQYGIDFHTGSHFRTNLPQVRGDLDDVQTRRCAEAFGAPVMIHARMRDGSLREAATRRGSHVVVYEGGEALRFDRSVIKTGVRGVLRVLAELGMRKLKARPVPPPREAVNTQWVRAGRGGILFLEAVPGQWVRAGEVVGVISDTFSSKYLNVRAPQDGLVIGVTTNPLVQRGDALLNLAEVRPEAGQEPGP
jgi:predicted deacylase